MNDIWYMLQDHDRYVYHYTRGAALINILRSRRLRFSRFRFVNDPRESKNWVFNYYSRTVDLNFDTRPVEKQLNDLLKHSWRIGCFVSDPYEALVTKQREEVGEDIIGAAYDRGHSRPRMWAQYGDDSRGACLVFDKTKLDSEILTLAKNIGSEVYAGKVTYCNPCIVSSFGRPFALTISVDEIHRCGIVEAAQNHITQHWKELFLVKSRDWEQEVEFRWLVSGNGDEDFFVDIGSSLAGIALGDRCSSFVNRTVGRFTRLNSVSVAIMNWQNGFPQPGPTHWRLLLRSSGMNRRENV